MGRTGENTRACADYHRRCVQHGPLGAVAVAMWILCSVGCGAGANPTAADTTPPPSTAGAGSEQPTEPLPPVEPAPLAQDIGQAVTSVMTAGHRNDKRIARNVHRHPAETLAFMGLRQDMTVVELWPGGGWYSSILAPVLRGRGKLLLADADPADKRWGRGIRKQLAQMGAERAVYGDVGLVRLSPPASINLGAAGSADMVLTFRNIHNWMGSGSLPAVFADAFRVLRPGGIFGIVEHRAAEGSDPALTAKQGYVSEAHVIAVAQAAGFELQERSEINANPKDTRDHPKGVWTLPPALSLGDTDRQKWLDIGESDRMTLRFTKPE